MRTVARLILVALWSPLLAVPAYAHHSFGQFDDKRCIAVEGAVKKFEFVYPHSWLWVTAKGADGSDVLWGLEMSDPATLAVYGWNPEFIRKGDKVKVLLNPLRDGRNGGSLRYVTLASGKTISAQGDQKVFQECVPSK